MAKREPFHKIKSIAEIERKPEKPEYAPDPDPVNFDDVGFKI